MLGLSVSPHVGRSVCLWRHGFWSQSRFVVRSSHRTISTSSASPRITSGSVWTSIIPKRLRQASKHGTQISTEGRKDWNPATFYIVIFLIIGSNAIQMIALRNELQNFSRKSETRIGLLKDAVERVHRGEDVDVEKLLGTGDKTQEDEWDEVMRELQATDLQFGGNLSETNTHGKRDDNESSNGNQGESDHFSSTNRSDSLVQDDDRPTPEMRQKAQKNRFY